MENYNDIPVVEAEAPVKEKGKGLAITALVFSIVGAIPCVNLIVCGLGPLVGLILSLVSRAQNGGKFSGMAKAALIISIIALALGLLSALAYIVYCIAMGISIGAMSSLPSVADPNYYY